MNEIIFYQKMSAPIGSLHLYANNKLLVALRFEKNSGFNVLNQSNPILSLATKQLHEYFEGRRQSFDIPLQLSGTPFQLQAWNFLVTIPFGETASYSMQAASIAKPKAVRAVGSANAKNSFPIVIPCHRVVRSSGLIGGYAGGSELKGWLLKFEKHIQG